MGWASLVWPQGGARAVAKPASNGRANVVVVGRGQVAGRGTLLLLRFSQGVPPAGGMQHGGESGKDTWFFSISPSIASCLRELAKGSRAGVKPLLGSATAPRRTNVLDRSRLVHS